MKIADSLWPRSREPILRVLARPQPGLRERPGNGPLTESCRFRLLTGFGRNSADHTPPPNSRAGAISAPIGTGTCSRRPSRRVTLAPAPFVQPHPGRHHEPSAQTLIFRSPAAGLPRHSASSVGLLERKERWRRLSRSRRRRSTCMSALACPGTGRKITLTCSRDCASPDGRAEAAVVAFPTIQLNRC